MKIPPQPFHLAGGVVVCEPRERSPQIIQGHLLKHPVGLTGLAAGRQWSEERWDELGVIDASIRDAFIAQVLRLNVNGAECGVPEFRSPPGSSSIGAVACDGCPPALASACCDLAAPSLGARYFGVLHALLEAASSPGAVRVGKETLFRQAFAALRDPERLNDLVVGYAGLDARKKAMPIVRLNRADGTRAEFYIEEPNKLAWRTLYRDPQAVSTANGRLQFLLAAPPQGKSTMALSDLCFVSRPFWEAS